SHPLRAVSLFLLFPRPPPPRSPLFPYTTLFRSTDAGDGAPKPVLTSLRLHLRRVAQLVRGYAAGALAAAPAARRGGRRHAGHLRHGPAAPGAHRDLRDLLRRTAPHHRSFGTAARRA